jgi:hypothetical protein
MLILISPSAVDGAEGGGGLDYRHLLISFDDNGVVSDLETSKSEKTVGCNRAGVCGIGNTYMLIAPEKKEQAVKHFDVPEGRCAVYVYGKPGTPIRISLDGKAIGGLLGKQEFIFEQLDQGDRSLGATGPNTRRYRNIEFSCDSGGMVFIQVRTTRPGVFFGRFDVEVPRRETTEGRLAIEDRKLLLRAGT